MCFKVARESWIYVCLCIGLPNESLLGIYAWLRDARCPSVLIRSCRTYDCSDRITITNSICQKFNDDDPKAFSSGIAICTLIETEASTFWRQEIHVGQGQKGIDSENGVSARHKSLNFIVSLLCSSILTPEIHHG